MRQLKCGIRTKMRNGKRKKKTNGKAGRYQEKGDRKEVMIKMMTIMTLVTTNLCRTEKGEKNRGHMDSCRPALGDRQTVSFRTI